MGGVRRAARGEGGLSVAYLRERLGYPHGWLSEPSYTLRVDMENAEPSAPWQLDDWSPESWEAVDGAPPE